VSLLAAHALGEGPAAIRQSRWPESRPAAARRQASSTAQAGQMLLFLLTMLLAGMVLSNLVEEKGNKIIEILAAAIPMDAVFLGKLFAMLACRWSASRSGDWPAARCGSAPETRCPAYPAPAVGWPLFLTLGVVYFAMGYLLLGSIFLAIGRWRRRCAKCRRCRCR
jgi:ABC-2 type transport system permease protein